MFSSDKMLLTIILSYPSDSISALPTLIPMYDYVRQGIQTSNFWEADCLLFYNCFLGWKLWSIGEKDFSGLQMYFYQRDLLEIKSKYALYPPDKLSCNYYYSNNDIASRVVSSPLFQTFACKTLNCSFQTTICRPKNIFL